MHARALPDISSSPVTWSIEFSRILEPTDPAAFGPDVSHPRAIVIREDDCDSIGHWRQTQKQLATVQTIIEAIAGDIGIAVKKPPIRREPK